MCKKKQVLRNIKRSIIHYKHTCNSFKFSIEKKKDSLKKALFVDLTFVLKWESKVNQVKMINLVSHQEIPSTTFLSYSGKQFEILISML